MPPRQQVLRNLLTQDVSINIYVRSKGKLLDLFPSIDNNPKVHIYAGDISDKDLITSLLTNVSIIIFTLGWNENRPGPHIIEDGARAIITSLQTLQDSGTLKTPPRLLLLSSSTWNTHLNGQNPSLLVKVIRTAFYHPYADLLAGQRVVHAHPDLVSVTLIQPPALVDQAPSGHDISVEMVGVATSYPDLGNAIVEIALEERYQNLAQVLVSSKNGYEFAKYAGVVLPKVVKGLAASLVPGFWSIHDSLERFWS
ncbi:hypothetical protein E4T47_04655 [Aureobasidium subglaciale]|nr:hypothetical protein E4T47_04655 [Aureobasidium subglaciale]